MTSFISVCLVHAVYLKELQARADSCIRGNALLIVISRTLNGLVQQLHQSTKVRQIITYYNTFFLKTSKCVPREKLKYFSVL